jgi:hypothetical protein
MSQGEYEEALPLYHRALHINVEALGLEHSEVAMVRQSLASFRIESPIKWNIIAFPIG